MEQNKAKCLDCMEKIKRRLDETGFSTFMTPDKENVLCKVSANGLANTTKLVYSNTNTSNTTCPHVTATSCPHTACKYPNVKCSHHNHINSDNNDYNNTLESTVSIGDNSVFRIMPNDIYTGLFLHVIKLHGEICELKMSFEYNENGKQIRRTYYDGKGNITHYSTFEYHENGKQKQPFLRT